MSATAIPLAEPSPMEAAREAVEPTRRLLFPFSFERWLTLGFVAFLDQCGRGGVGGAWPGSPPAGGFPGTGNGSGTGDLSNLGSWFTAHLGLFAGGAAGVLVAVRILVAVCVRFGTAR